MSSSLENFIYEVTRKGLARTNLFSVEIPTPPCLPRNAAPSFLSLFCQTASFPPTNIGVRDLRIFGPTYKRPYNVDYGGEGISMTFLIDRKMELKKYFDLWMHNVVDPDEYHVFYDEGDTKYTTDITVKQITEIQPGKKIYENNGYESIAPAQDITNEYIIKIQDAFPRNVGMIELDTTAQNATHKLTVNFAYRKVIFNPGGIEVTFRQ